MGRKYQNMERIVGITCVFILGIIFIIAGKLFLMKDKKLKNNGIKTSAIVTEKKKGLNKGVSVKIEYTAGEEIITKKITTSRFLFSYEKGDKINIFYNKDKPESFCFENDKRYIVIAAIFFYCAAMEILAGVLGIFRGL